MEWKQVGGKLGSNEGGVYELTDPATGGKQQHYVKFPKNPEQAKTEVLAADVLGSMGVLTSNPKLQMINGKMAVTTRWQELHKVDWGTNTASLIVNGLSSEQRIQLAQMYYAAALTENWDALGLDFSNIMKDKLGNLVQMDTGGSFEFRAQGKNKPYSADITQTLTNLMNPQYAAGKVFSTLNQYDPKAFADALSRIKMMNAPAAKQSFVDSTQGKLYAAFEARFKALTTAPKKTVAPKVLAPLDPEVLKKMKTGARVKHQMRVSHQLNGPQASEIIMTVIKCPPPPVTPKNKAVVKDYVDGSGGINGSLRHAKGDLTKVEQYYREKIEVLDEMMRNARDYSITMEVTRGIPRTVIEKMNVGDTFVDHAFSSTSFSRDKAKNFGGGAAHLEIRLPQGFKFLSVPSFAAAGGEKHGLALAEAEAILPRGCGYKIREIKQEGHRKVYYVDAIFSSVQPPREKWVSSLTEKREAKKAAAKAAAPPSEPGAQQV